MDKLNNKLIQACRKGKFDSVKNLVENKADITVETNEPLISACYSGHLNIVKFLVENKADISAGNNQAVRWASYNGRLDVIKFLVENKADITAQDNHAVSRASYYNHFDLVKFLLSLGADYNQVHPEMKIKILQDKYYRKWRRIVLKRFICKVITPLYYSSGFIGGENEKKRIRDVLSNFNSDNQLDISL